MEETQTHGWTNSSSAGGDHSAGVTEATVLHTLLSGNTTFHHAGKRHHYDHTVDNHATAESPTLTKRGRPPYPYYVTGATTAAWPASPPAAAAVVPRCQVEGCHVALGNVKDYYRKHKVCEIHSKAPKVVVLGRQQRFCQQCSRFHGVTEFDEAKRSCRRRLKGHNQRRRKGTLSIPHSMTVRRLGPPSPPATPGCALSFLSSPVTDHWNSSGDFSSRSGAAVVYELMAANGATSVLGHLLNQNSCDQSVADDYTLADTQMWDRLGYAGDLKQAAALEFGVLSAKEKSRDPEEWTDYCWSTFGGANVV